MAELRSFLVGVVIAGVVLLAAGIAFGVFGGDSSGSPTVRLLGTPPATRTPAPPSTRDPSEFTPVAPADTQQPPSGETPGVETPEVETPGAGTPAVVETVNPILTATPTLETAPTAAPATSTPAINPVLVYVDTANTYTPGLVAQLEYLAGNAGAPNITNTDWRAFTVESAQTIQVLSASIAGIAAPGCVSSAHGSLVAAANQASGAAGAVIAAVNSNDGSAASAQVGSLLGARDAVDGAVVAVSNAIPSC